MKALILAGGFAKRMGSIAEDTPKALLLLRGKPMLEHVLRKIEPLEQIDQIYISINKRFEQQFTEFLQHRTSSRFIKLVVENTMEEGEKLGSVGGIRHFLDKEDTTDPLLVIASDNIFDSGLFGMMLLYKRMKSPIVGLYDVNNMERAKRLGIASIDEKGRITDFEEKPEEPKSTLASTGIYIFTYPALKKVYPYLATNSGDRMGDFIKWLSEQEKVYGFVLQGKWYDIGSPEEYKRAEEELD